MAKPRPEKKLQKSKPVQPSLPGMPPREPPGTTRLFSMQIQVGDKFSDESGEWEVSGTRTRPLAPCQRPATPSTRPQAPRGMTDHAQGPVTPEASPASVRTLSGATLIASPCPVCRKHPLQGRQTVCSARCRRIRSRRREAEARQHRDDELRVLAFAARQAIEALERRLEDAT